MEYKRRTIINEINNVAYALHKTSLPAIYINPISTGAPNYVQDDILAMEVDPRESKWYAYFIMYKLIFWVVSNKKFKKLLLLLYK